jgi:hypothetical protein
LLLLDRLISGCPHIALLKSLAEVDGHWLIFAAFMDNHPYVSIGIFWQILSVCQVFITIDVKQ